MGSCVGHIQKEWLFVAGILLNFFDGLFSKSICCVIVVRDRFDGRCAANEGERIEVVDHTPNDSVMGIEAAADRIGFRVGKLFQNDLVVQVSHVSRPHLCLREMPLADHAGVVAVIAEYFEDWWPAMTTMEIQSLSSAPARLEIEMIAVIPRGL